MENGRDTKPTFSTFFLQKFAKCDFCCIVAPRCAYIVQIANGDVVKDYIEERVMDVACYVVQHNCTVRNVARVFCISKSTAHKDLTERLPLLNKELFLLVEKVLNNNWAERYLRGGQATKKKYQKM